MIANRSIEICSDIVTFPQAKNTGNLQGLILNPNSSASSLGQWYDAPQPLTISGFDFFAWQDDPNSSQAVTVACNLYKAGANYLPEGSPLATVSVTVDTTFGNGNLQTYLKKTATFSSPVTVSFPYILMVESSSSISIAMVTNDWNTGSGNQENLAVVRISNSWYRGLSVTVNGTAFDSDVLVHPHVSYNLKTSFAKDRTCIASGDTVHFTNTSSPVFNSRFYNRFVFNNTPEQTWTWNFGDASPLLHEESPSHAYAPEQKYIVSMKSIQNAWSHNCTATILDSVDRHPVANFAWGGYNATKQFFNQSLGADWVYWDFGDGNFTTLYNPVYTFANAGTYDVALVVGNACDTDTLVQQVTVYPVGIREQSVPGLRVGPNPFHNALQIYYDGIPVGHWLLQITDLSGRDLCQWQGEAGQKLPARIVLDQLKPGLYVVIYREGAYCFRQKFIALE